MLIFHLYALAMRRNMNWVTEYFYERRREMAKQEPLESLAVAAQEAAANLKSARAAAKPLMKKLDEARKAAKEAQAAFETFQATKK